MELEKRLQELTDLVADRVNEGVNIPNVEVSENPLEVEIKKMQEVIDEKGVIE